MKTIRVSDEAYTILMEVLGLMQYRKARAGKGEKISLARVIDKIIELIPESWRKLTLEEASLAR